MGRVKSRFDSGLIFSRVSLMNIRSELSALVFDKEEHVPAFANYLREKELLVAIN